MGDKLVTTLPGIGAVFGRRLSDLGYSNAYQVFGQFLIDRYHFMEWLKVSCGANSKQQSDCYNCLNVWSNSYFPLVPSSGHFCKNFQYPVCAEIDLHVKFISEIRLSGCVQLY